jgi:DNA-binding LacI/PurR family transcriptional regulator
VRQPLQKLGQQATDTLLALIDGRQAGAPRVAPRNIVLPTEIVTGATLAAPRGDPLPIA